MKKHLPLSQRYLVHPRFFSVVLLLLVLLCTGNISQAQIWYTTAGSTAAADAGDGLARINYDGSGYVSIKTAIAPTTVYTAIDYGGNRAFIYDNTTGTKQIKVVNMTTSSVTTTITVPDALTAIRYDAASGFIYYLTLGAGGGNSTIATDALRKVKPDGTSDQLVVSSIVATPKLLALDLPNNRVFVIDAFGASISLKRIVFGASPTTATSTTLFTQSNAINGIDYNQADGNLYFIQTDGSYKTSTAADAVKKIDGNAAAGSTATVLASSMAYSATLFALDAGNDRAFFFEGAAVADAPVKGVLKSVTLSTGAVSGAILNIASYSGVAGINALNVPQVATLTTTAAAGITATSATLGGNVSQSDVTVSGRGIVYSSSNSVPTIGGTNVNQSANGSGTGSFSANLTGLNAVTTYYVRAYATSGAGTAYGAVSSFTTTSNDATLSAFLLSSGTLNPSFSSATVTYTASVASSTASITVTPTRNQSSATIKVNGTAVNSGSASGNINLAIGDNAISTVVTAQDGSTTKTYTVTVNRPKASQTITFNALSAQTYGGSDFLPGASASSGLGISYTSDNTAVATIVSGKIHIVTAGTANITAAQVGDANTLAATSVIQALTVGKASVTATATAASKNYGDNDPTLAYTITTGALVGSDAFTGTLTRDAGVNVGSYNITQGTLALNANYTLSFVTNTLTINKRPISIQPVAATKVYGDSDPAYPYTIGNGSLASGDAFTGSFTRVAGEIPGTYALSVGTKIPVNATTNADQSGNYTLTFVPDNLTITKRLLTLQPNPATKVYGAVDPAFPYKITGTLPANEGMTGSFGRATGENAGVYALTLGTKGPVNITTGDFTAAYYTITFVSDNLTITKLDEVITARSQSKTYGATDPVLTFSYSNPLPFTDTFSGALTRNAGESVGSYNITQGTLALNNTNYNLVSFTGSTFAINAKTINVAANAQTKTYGDADPALTYTADALVSGDSFTGSLTRVVGESVGTRAINHGNLALSGNYILNYTGNNLTIGVKGINVTANAQTKIYGDTDPALTYTADALASGDTFSGSLTRNAGETVGAYNINQGNLALNANYTLNYTVNILAIGKATLSYLATPASKNYLAANPAFTGTVTGFISGDTQASATTGTLSFTSTATASSPQGSYPISGSGLSAANYNFIQALANGTALSIVLSADAFLSSLSISQGTFNTPFDAGTYQYFANVANSVTSFDLTAVVNQANASITVNGTALTSGLATTLPLSAGSNNFTIVITAQDGSTTQSYLVGINRALSSNNLLSGITMSGLTLNPTFDSGTVSYTSSVGNLVEATDIYATPADNNAVAQVAGNRVSAVTSYHQLLIVGDNPVTVTGIAQNGDSRDYVVTITRAPSTDASLSAINTTGFSLIEPFSSVNYNYTANVTAYVAQVNFVPVSTNNGAAITVNGAVVNSSGFTATLGFGVNTYNIVVTAQDGVTTHTYMLSITRALSSDATLSTLTIPYQITINESFDPAVLNYTANLADSTITGLPLTAISNDVNATVKINGDAVPRFVNYLMALHGGDNTFNIVVTPQDNSAAKTYTLVLTRAGQAPPLFSPDASLAAISISATGYSYNFNFAYDVLKPLNVGNKITAVRLHPVTGNVGATTTVNGVAIAYDASTDLLPLNVGDNIFDVVVTAADGVHQTTTTLHINRLPAADISLTSLALNAGTLSPAFAGTTFTYTASVPYSFSSLNVTPVASAADATVTIGATTISAGTPSASVPLNVGLPNRIRVTVTAADGVNTQTYSVNVTRLAPDASLASVSVSGGSSVTHPTATTYATQVAYNTAILAVTPTAVDPGSTITVDGNPVVSGSASTGITLDNTAGATTTIPIVVTASDGVTTQSYSLAVTHLAQPTLGGDATLASLGTSLGTLSPFFDRSITSYTTIVTSSTISFTSVSVDHNATITINGNAITTNLPLNVGDNIFSVLVTAQDGTTTKVYMVKVTRKILSSDITVKSFLISSGSLIRVGTTNTFTSSVSPSVSTVALTVMPGDVNATVKVNNTLTGNGITSSPIALVGFTTTIPVLLTAEDGISTRAITVIVSKGGSNNADIKTLSMNSGTLKSIAGTGDYSVSVSSSLSSIAITCLLADGTATLKINDVATGNGVLSAPVTLSSLTTTIPVVVTAEDGITTKTANIIVSKTGSSDITVKSFLISSGNLIRVGTTNTFTSSVSPSVSTVALTVMPGDVNATVKVNNTLTGNGITSSPIALVGFTTTIPVLLTAEDGISTRAITVIVSKGGSNNADIKTLSMNSGTLKSIAGTGDYSVSVSSSLSSIAITCLLADGTATLKINDVATGNGVLSAPVTLSSLTTTIPVVVTAEDGITTKTANIIVSKTGSSDITVKSFLISSGSLIRVGTTNTFTSSVSPSVSTVALTVMPGDVNATVKVNNTLTGNGITSSPIALVGFTTTIPVLLTAEDGITTRAITVIVSKTQSFANKISPVLIAKKSNDVLSDDLIVHQALSPNGDGQNDILTIDGIENHTDNHLSIMNAGGTLVYDVKGYGTNGNVFDGHSNKTGTMQRPGTYYYSLEYSDGKETKRKTGYIIIKY